MNPSPATARAAWLAAALSLALTGCSAFRPVETTERHFVLSPAAPPDSPPPTAPPPTATVTVGPVRIPAYLASRHLAIRTSATEITYADTALWAERLDKGSQRVLAANLAQSLPQALVVTAPGPKEAALELHVRVSQLDVDTSGNGTLDAAWRVVSPAAGQTLASGRHRYVAPGPHPGPHPAEAVGTLSTLWGNLAKDLAPVLARLAAGAR